MFTLPRHAGYPVTGRYSAYALALELGWSDVDAMLASMTAMQIQEWFASFRIRNDEKPAGEPAGYGYGKAVLDVSLVLTAFSIMYTVKCLRHAITAKRPPPSKYVFHFRTGANSTL